MFFVHVKRIYLNLFKKKKERMLFMKTEKFNLWEKTPGLCEEIPTLTAYIPEEKKSDGAVVIFPGGAYCTRAPHEGEGYAKFLCENGITAFVCDYRVSPHRFPLPLLDARRAVKSVRFYSEKYGIDKNKISVMGSSAGGHLAALTSTYFDELELEYTDDIDKEDFKPNAQILCYPVIKLLSQRDGAHIGSTNNLLGDKALEMAEEITPELIASSDTPKAFIWHTFEDNAVSITNSLDYAKALKKNNVPVEMHVFPYGYHGLGLPTGDDKLSKHISQWGKLLLNWLAYEEL